MTGRAGQCGGEGRSVHAVTSSSSSQPLEGPGKGTNDCGEQQRAPGRQRASEAERGCQHVPAGPRRGAHKAPKKAYLLSGALNKTDQQESKSSPLGAEAHKRSPPNREQEGALGPRGGTRAVGETTPQKTSEVAAPCSVGGPQRGSVGAQRDSPSSSTAPSKSEALSRANGLKRENPSPSVTQVDKVSSVSYDSSSSSCEGGQPGAGEGYPQHPQGSLRPPSADQTTSAYDIPFQMKVETDSEDNSSTVSTNSADITSTMTNREVCNVQASPLELEPPPPTKATPTTSVQKKHQYQQLNHSNPGRQDGALRCCEDEGGAQQGPQRGPHPVKLEDRSRGVSSQECYRNPSSSAAAAVATSSVISREGYAPNPGPLSPSDPRKKSQPAIEGLQGPYGPKHPPNISSSSFFPPEAPNGGRQAQDFQGSGPAYPGKGPQKGPHLAGGPATSSYAASQQQQPARPVSQGARQHGGAPARHNSAPRGQGDPQNCMQPPSQAPPSLGSGNCPSSTSMRPPPPPQLKVKAGEKAGHGHHHPQHHQHQQEEPSSSIPDLEFDGTTVLCRVCGDKASGFHYGVHSCEGCKGFFRRSIQQKIQYRPCTKNQQCSILRINRNRCQYCRLRKCIAVGMSRDAVRFGRVPKREKARILAAMHQSCQSRSAERAAVAEQLNGVSANGSGATAAASSDSSVVSGASSGVGVGGGPPQGPEEAKEEEATPWREPQGVAGEAEESGPEDELEATRLANTVLRAHSDTCHFAHLRPKEGPRAQGGQSAGGPVYSVPGRNGPILACPLNPRRPLVAGLTTGDANGRGEDTVLQDFSQRFSPAIRGVVEFAKRIPGFALLSQSDQVTLLKAGVFEVLLLRLACLFDSQSNTMTCLNGELLRRESIVSHSPSSSPSRSPSSHASNARFLVDSMFEFAARLNALQLSDAQLALFSAVVIIAPDRPGLRHTDLISRIHSRLLSALSMLLHAHPSSAVHGAPPGGLLSTLQSYIPDLRTLNTLHSEKLLAFKMTEQQQHQQQQHQGEGGQVEEQHHRCTHPEEATCKQYVQHQQGRNPMPEGTCRNQHQQARAMAMHGSGQQQVASQCPRQALVHHDASPDHSMNGSMPLDAMAHHQQHHDAISWKEEEVHEVEDLEEEEEDKWRSGGARECPGGRAPTAGGVVSGLKSPLGSVSSSESVCSGEVASLSEFRTASTNSTSASASSSISASAPLLAATLAGGSSGACAVPGFPKRRRHRDRSGSNSEEDTSCSGSAAPAGAPCTAAQASAHLSTAHRTTYFRKLDSPSDSGIESGTERLEKSSTSTSVCSSPRSSLEDKDDVVLGQHHHGKAAQVVPSQHQQGPPRNRCPHHLERPSTVEDMPVLKRVLQAPPLYDTNSLMDEAYKPHKKFRALRKDCAEAEAMGSAAPPAMVHARLQEPAVGVQKPSYATLEGGRARGGGGEASEHHHARAPSPPLVVLSPPANPAPSASPHSIISTLNIHLPQITIHAQPMRIVSPGEQHLPSPLHPSAQHQHQQGGNPPLLLQKALLQPPANQRSLQSHQHQALLSALSGDAPGPRRAPSPAQPMAQSSPLTASLLSAPTLNSSLSSTHSTLARSLMEGPKMTAEQMKHTDIIHSYIMRESGEEGPSCAPQPVYCKAQAQGPVQGSYRPAKASPEPVMVQGHELVEEGYRASKVAPQQGYGRGQGCAGSKEQQASSPGVLVFSGTYLSQMGWNGEKGQCSTQCGAQQQQQGGGGDVVMGYPSTVQEVKPPQGGQPLNLSKKTPPPSPAALPVVSASILEA